MEVDEEQERECIDAAVRSCLGKISIIRPRDFTYSSAVATLESLRQSLDNQRLDKLQNQRSAQCPNGTGHQQTSAGVEINPELRSLEDEEEPPMLILIDSLSTLSSSTRANENLTTATSASRAGGVSSGLSGRDEFHRQLRRLLEEHSIAIVGTCLDNSVSSNMARGGRERQHSTNRGSVGNIWDRMVTHRISLRRAVNGTKEDQDGYDFVALPSSSSTPTGSNEPHDGCANDVFPFSILHGGISC